MRATLQYTFEDLVKLVVANAQAQGYAVSPEDVTPGPHGELTVTFSKELTPTPSPTPSPGVPVNPLRASEGRPASPPADGPADPPPEPPAWTSRPADGSDGRYVPIEPPSASRRIPRVREIGTPTGLVEREGIQPTGFPGGDGADQLVARKSPTRPNRDGEATFRGPSSFTEDLLTRFAEPD